MGEPGLWCCFFGGAKGLVSSRRRFPADCRPAYGPEATTVCLETPGMVGTASIDLGEGAGESLLIADSSGSGTGSTALADSTLSGIAPSFSGKTRGIDSRFLIVATAFSSSAWSSAIRSSFQGKRDEMVLYLQSGILDRLPYNINILTRVISLVLLSSKAP